MTNAKDLTCRELVELVTDYLEGALPAADRARFERHLAECEYCRTYLDQMQITIRALGGLPAPALETEEVRALLEHFRDWTRDRPAR